MTTAISFRTFFAIASTCFLCSSYAVAQGITDADHIERIRKNHLPLQVGLSLSILNPQGEFRDALLSVGSPSVGIGFSSHVSYQPFAAPFAATLTLSPTFTGGTSILVPFDGSLFNSREATSQSMIVPVFAGVRLQPSIMGWVFPYVELNGGATIMHASARYRESDMLRSSERRESRVDATLNYGGGVGMAVSLLEMINLPNSLKRITLDVSLRYLAGGSLDVARGTIDSQQTDFVWSPSGTSNMVLFCAGITVQL